mmetsp:Transcript_105310/g.128550  ORF Transcript_105310/g.128550 Transcript_105310/m.128550 type:complete len:136 (+) Transcript_105310:117-524(+)
MKTVGIKRKRMFNDDNNMENRKPPTKRMRYTCNKPIKLIKYQQKRINKHTYKIPRKSFTNNKLRYDRSITKSNCIEYKLKESKMMNYSDDDIDIDIDMEIKNTNQDDNNIPWWKKKNKVRRSGSGFLVSCGIGVE